MKPRRWSLAFIDGPTVIMTEREIREKLGEADLFAIKQGLWCEGSAVPV